MSRTLGLAALAFIASAAPALAGEKIQLGAGSLWRKHYKF